jgi:hypothetical protein
MAKGSGTSGAVGLRIVGTKARQRPSVARYVITTMTGNMQLPFHVWTREEWRTLPDDQRPEDAILLPNGCVAWLAPPEAPGAALGVPQAP